MAKKQSTMPKPSATITVKLGTAMSSMVPFDVKIDGVFVPRTNATEGAIAKLPAADAERMIAKGRAARVD